MSQTEHYPARTDVDEETELLEPEQLVSGSNGAAPSSLLSELRGRRDEIAANQTLELLVPGYRGKLALRVGPIDGRVQTTLLERLAKSKAPDRDFSLNADYISAALREVVGRETFDGEWRPLGEIAQLEGDQTVRLDDRLIGLLGLEPASRTAREVLRSLYGLAPSPEVAITLAGGEYISWAGSANAEVDEEFAGESLGAPR